MSNSRPEMLHTWIPELERLIAHSLEKSKESHFVPRPAVHAAWYFKQPEKLLSLAQSLPPVSSREDWGRFRGELALALTDLGQQDQALSVIQSFRSEQFRDPWRAEDLTKLGLLMENEDLIEQARWIAHCYPKPESILGLFVRIAELTEDPRDIQDARAAIHTSGSGTSTRAQIKLALAESNIDLARTLRDHQAQLTVGTCALLAERTWDAEDLDLLWHGLRRHRGLRDADPSEWLRIFEIAFLHANVEQVRSLLSNIENDRKTLVCAVASLRFPSAYFLDIADHHVSDVFRRQTGWHTETRNALIRAQAASHNWSRALELALPITDPSQKCSALLLIHQTLSGGAPELPWEYWILPDSN